MLSFDASSASVGARRSSCSSLACATSISRARELNLSLEEFQESLVKISSSTVVALDELWAVSDSSGDAVSLLDTLHDPDAPDPQQMLAQSEVKDRLADAIAALPEREKLVIALYYYENLTLREIGEVLGVTESRISQLRAEAMVLLRDGINAQLDPHLVPVHDRPEGVAARRREAYFAAVAERHAAAGVLVPQVATSA
jgi:RNA polymerase sigma factor (sigma-70 family)